MEKKENKYSKYGINEKDLEYLDESMAYLLKNEMKKEKPNSKIIDAFKKYIEINKFLEIWLASYKAYTVNTDTLNFLWSRLENIPSNSPEYNILMKILELDTKIKIWLASFFSYENKFIILIKNEDIDSAIKIMNKLEVESLIGKKLFYEFDQKTKEYKNLMLISSEKTDEVKDYFNYIE
ncbi:MAG: hypothetical protein ACP5IB_00655 [Thermoplasmata archaeon]